MPWLLLVLLFAAPARAQLDAPATAECTGCTVGWTDPYVHEIALQRVRRPTYFWPNMVMLAGATILAGSMVVVSEEIDGYDHPTAKLATPLAVGGAVLTAGVVWRLIRRRERQPYERRIAELQAAREQLPQIALAPPPDPRKDEIVALKRARPSAALPAVVTIAGSVLAGWGAVMVSLGDVDDDRGLTLGGLGLSAVGALAAVLGGIWWSDVRAEQRGYNERIRALKLDLSGAPFLVRW